MRRASKKLKKLILEVLVLAIGFFYVLPIIFLFLNTFKTQNEMFESFLSLPKDFYIENYIRAWNNMKYLRAFMNTLTVTIGTVALIVVMSSMAAYRIARSKSKRATGLLIFFIISMMMPFQTIMLPLMRIVAGLGLTASLGGYIVVAAGLMCPFTIYLYRGFYSQIPVEIEEAARIDGANPFQVFFITVLPLLKPITVTVIIINVMNVWNDFILALLMLQRRDKMTLQISVMQYTGLYNLEWNLTLATLAIVILPVIILYICLQNSIQSGLTAGAIKA
jgi:raffinose/stachyose/melibiose transport system permease protein